MKKHTGGIVAAAEALVDNRVFSMEPQPIVPQRDDTKYLDGEWIPSRGPRLPRRHIAYAILSRACGLFVTVQTVRRSASSNQAKAERVLLRKEGALPRWEAGQLTHDWGCAFSVGLRFLSRQRTPTIL